MINNCVTCPNQGCLHSFTTHRTCLCSLMMVAVISISSNGLIGYITLLIALRFRPVARGVRRTTPNMPKGPLFATKWAKNGVLREGLYRPKRSTFWCFILPLKSSVATGLLQFQNNGLSNLLPVWHSTSKTSQELLDQPKLGLFVFLKLVLYSWCILH